MDSLESVPPASGLLVMDVRISELSVVYQYWTAALHIND